MSEYSLHLCLVSKQATPNLVPLIDPQVPVDEVILLHTEGFKPQAQWLQKALAIYQVKSQLTVLPSADDMTQLHEFFFSFYEQIKQKYPSLRLYCNLTSGTKAMSIALYELALMTAQDGTQAYYQNLDDTLSWFVPLKPERHEIEDRVKIKPFLLAHGIETLTPSNSKVSPAWRPLIDELIANLNYYQKAISTLNFHAVRAEKTPQLTSEYDAAQRFPHFEALLDLLQTHGLLSWQGDKIRFASEQARFFSAGGWLEEYVYHTLRKMKAKNPRMQDLEQGLEIESLLKQKSQTVKNELDVVVLVNNRLIVMECKTYKTNTDQPQASIYKLDTLATQVGGAFGKGILITLNPLKQADYERAQRYGIEVIQGDRFAQLHTALERIVN